MGAKTRLRAKCVERGANENMFGVLVISHCNCQITILMKGQCGDRVAGLPEVLKDGIMRSPFESTIVDCSDTLGRHDGDFIWCDSNEGQDLAIVVHVSMIVCITSFVLIYFPHDENARDWCGPVD